MGNLEIIDEQGIANAFNNYFVSVGPGLAAKIPSVSSTFEKYLNTSLSNSMVLFPVSAKEIEQEIDNLNISKSTGPFSIPVKVFKILRNFLSAPLAYVINYSFSNGVVPDKFKLARVIPIYKKGSKSILSNYRPISLISGFGKIMEKLMYNRLIDFLNKNNVFYSSQFGFRANHSTTHAVLQITDKIQNAIENKLFSCGIFLDLTKAFDTVDHNILIRKLEYYGIRGLLGDWFRSYLTDRYQFVSVKNTNSQQKPITCGVPQGSVLGPLLFLLYINDFYKCAPDLDFHLFADDSNLLCSDRNLQILESKVNNQLQKVYEWLCANKLSLNVDKTNFVIFYPPQRKRTSTFKLLMGRKDIKEKSSVNYLGVIIDCNLNWKVHVHELSKKLARSIGVLSKLRHFVPMGILIQLYHAIIFPFLIYSVIVWGNTYQSNLHPIVVLQKKAIRIITFFASREHTSPLFKKLNLLKFYDIVYVNTAFFVHQYSNAKLPDVFSDFFTLIRTQHNYNTRLASRSTYSLPSVRTNYGKFRVRFIGTQIWNDIDESFKTLSIYTFKQKLKRKIIDAY